jgi:hypothetical protein
MENTWEFNTLVGEGSELVTIVYEYEKDEDGTYNEGIKEILFKGHDVIGLFADKQFKELEMEAAMRFHEHKINYKQTSDFEP